MAANVVQASFSHVGGPNRSEAELRIEREQRFFERRELANAGCEPGHYDSTYLRFYDQAGVITKFARTQHIYSATVRCAVVKGLVIQELGRALSLNRPVAIMRSNGRYGPLASNEIHELQEALALAWIMELFIIRTDDLCGTVRRVLCLV